MYRIENKSDAVKDVQNRLIEISDEKIEAVPNGIYDDDTRGEVEKFQDLHGLPKTGIVDYETFTVINKEHKRKLVGNRVNRESVYAIDFPIAFGDFGSDVAEINTAMYNFLERYSYSTHIKERKYFSKESVVAMQKIREILLLDMKDTVDEEMYYRMKLDEYASVIFNV